MLVGVEVTPVFWCPSKWNKPLRLLLSVFGYTFFAVRQKYVVNRAVESHRRRCTVCRGATTRTCRYLVISTSSCRHSSLKRSSRAPFEGTEGEPAGNGGEGQGMGAVRDLIAYDNLFLTLTCMHVFQTFFKSSFPSLYAMLLNTTSLYSKFI